MACFHIFLTPVMVHHSGGFDLVAVTCTMYYYIKRRESYHRPHYLLWDERGRTKDTRVLKQGMVRELR